VGTEYQMLLGNGQWEARSVQAETHQKILKAEIKNEFMEELRRMDVKTSGATQTGAAKGSKNSNTICSKCKEKGHITRNCPMKDAPQARRSQRTSQDPKSLQSQTLGRRARGQQYQQCQVLVVQMVNMMEFWRQEALHSST